MLYEFFMVFVFSKVLMSWVMLEYTAATNVLSAGIRHAYICTFWKQFCKILNMAEKTVELKFCAAYVKGILIYFLN